MKFRIPSLLVVLAFLPCLAMAAADGDDAGDVARGEYLARIGDCAACHTARGGQPYAGGRAIETPFGTVYAPNITPDTETGIGRWRVEDFRSAMHAGIAPGGKLLYPAFPFPSYTRITREDVDAIHAWLRSIPAVKRENRAPELRFPYSLRPLLMAWRAMFFDAGEYRPDPAKSAIWNRGGYLVEGLGHCNGCHTPRNRLGAIESQRALGGATIPAQDWYAPDLRPGPGGGLEGWSAEDVATFLKTGRSARGSAYGPMAEVVRQSLQYLTDDDAMAIATYLLDPPPRRDTKLADGLVAPPMQARNLMVEGEKIYRHHCAACHGDTGEGAGLVYPPLAGNRALLGPDVNVIRAVLLGGFQPATAADPRPYSMPPFAPQLDDREVAAVTTYIRQSWGNRASAVAPATVTRHRSVPRR